MDVRDRIFSTCLLKVNDMLLLDLSHYSIIPKCYLIKITFISWVLDWKKSKYHVSVPIKGWSEVCFQVKFNPTSMFTFQILAFRSTKINWTYKWTNLTLPNSTPDGGFLLKMTESHEARLKHPRTTNIWNTMLLALF